MEDNQGRKRRISSGGSGVQKRGSGLGTGPVGKSDGYAGRTGSSSGSGRTSSGGGRTPSQGSSGGSRKSSGGFNPIVLIIVVVVVLFGGGGGLSSLLGGGSSGSSSSGGSSYVSSQSGSTGHTSSGNTSHSSSSSYGSNSGSGLGGLLGSSGSGLGDLFGSLGFGSGSSYGSSGYGSGSSYGSSGYGSGSSYGSSGYGSGSSYGSSSNGSSSGAGNALQSLLNALGSSTPQSLTDTYSGWSDDNNTSTLNTGVSPEASGKYTKLKGNGRDTVTIMVYMCGTDLESRNSMATSDIVEMTKASLSDKVNVILYTGGCTKWNNNIISSRTNQIYQITDGGLKCLVSDDGDRTMTDPETLTRFIKWCRKNYPANRNELIFWDHGGGSVSGYGYDQKHARAGAMSLPQIKKAVQNSGMTFDFVGFDACLMATAETALALSDSADYLLASEETEPGTGWYYTNWLSALSSNTSLPTTELGKKIIDDFVDMSARQARGQSTTLSLVDLSELKETFPDGFSAFADGLNDLLENKQYTTIATARKHTREFAKRSHINQYDLVHLAKNLGTEEGKKLADIILGAVKYNRTSQDMSNSYGLAVYFPNQNKYTDSMAATYKALELSSSYADSFRKIAAVQEGGQAVSGGSHSLSDLLGSASGSSQGSLFDLAGSSLFGGSGSSGDAMMDMLGMLFSGRSVKSSYTTNFMAESGYTEKDLAEMLEGKIFNARNLTWNRDSGKYTLQLSAPDWSLVEHLQRNIFYDDGEGYIDLGLDNSYSVSDEGVLTAAADRYWISIDEHPVAFYHVTTTVSEEGPISIGRVPCLLNGDRCCLILVFDPENPYGYVAGASFDYINGETDALPKSVTALKDGDEIVFICDYYTYDQEYQDTYLLDQMVVDGEPEITDTYIGGNPAFVSYLFTDIYGQEYWTDPVWLN